MIYGLLVEGGKKFRNEIPVEFFRINFNMENRVGDDSRDMSRKKERKVSW